MDRRGVNFNQASPPTGNGAESEVTMVKPDGDDTPKLSGIERRKANLAPAWQPGQSGNPAGRPTGARSILQADFFKALQRKFELVHLSALQEEQ